jgi:S1-C subfamily serine protease
MSDLKQEINATKSIADANNNRLQCINDTLTSNGIITNDNVATLDSIEFSVGQLTALGDALKDRVSTLETDICQTKEDVEMTKENAVVADDEREALDCEVSELKEREQCLSHEVETIKAKAAVILSAEQVARLQYVCVTIYSQFDVDGSIYIGSGAYVCFPDDNKAWILTVAHVGLMMKNGTVARASKAFVANPISERWIEIGAADMFYDGVADIALFRTRLDVSEFKHAPLSLADKAARTGSQVFIMGDPLGSSTDSLASGHVRSANYIQKPTTYQINECISVDVPGYSGNSGSPIFNSELEIVGLYAFGIRNHSTYGGGSNLNSLKSSLSRLKLGHDNKGKVYYGLATGIPYPMTMLAINAKNSSTPAITRGISVISVDSQSPFAGIVRPGDILVSLHVSNGPTLIRNLTFGEGINYDNIGALLYLYGATTGRLDFIEGSTGNLRTNVPVQLHKRYAHVPEDKDLYLNTGLSELQRLEE